MAIKYRFEKREVIAAILGALLIPAIAQIVLQLSEYDLTFARISNNFVVEAIIVATVAAVSGPISSVVAGIGGYILEVVLIRNDISIALLIELSLIGYFVGRYYERIPVENENFMKERLIDFNLTQVISIIVGNVIFMPLVEFFQNGRNIYYMIKKGTIQCVFTCLMLLVIGSFAIYLRYLEEMRIKNLQDMKAAEDKKEDKYVGVEAVSEAAQILDAYN